MVDFRQINAVEGGESHKKISKAFEKVQRISKHK